MTATKKQLTPKLRFKEFKGEWEKKKLSNLTSKISDGLHSTPKYCDDGDYYFVNGNNLISGRITINANTKRVSKDEYEKHKKDLTNQSILISINGTIGSLAFYNNERVILGKSACYINLNREVDKLFIYNSLQTEAIIGFFNSELTGSTIKNLSLTTIKNCEFALPTLPEQQKIASFLSAVDEKIQQLTRKKELLEQYKKGVMHRLFKSSESEFTGLQDEQDGTENKILPILKSGKSRFRQLRFKPENGKAYPKWEEKRLGEVIKLQGGYAFKSNLFQTDGIPVIRISNISNEHNYIDLNNIVYYQEIERAENFTIKNGDLLIAMSGATTGKSSIYNLPYEAYLNQRVGLFKAINKSLNYSYLVQFVFSDEFRKQLDSVLVAGAQPNVSGSDIGGFKFIMPCIQEQQKIASFLSAIDTKIESVAHQITQTQTFKKGLLQQMFV